MYCAKTHLRTLSLVARKTPEGADKRQPTLRGFTLVELLVVVSIIALLISILLPSLSRARDQAKMVKCLAHTRGTGEAILIFSTEHSNRFQLTAHEKGRAAVDPSRQIYDYSSTGEILAWPVIVAWGTKIGYQYNWDWGVRALPTEALDPEKIKWMKKDLEMVTCPADKVRISSPFYPRGSSLVGQGDPKNPRAAGDGNLAYWGYLSFAVNEDITGTEGNDENPVDRQACWRAVQSKSEGGVWYACRGEHSYGTSGHPCGSSQLGFRLRGYLDGVWNPSTVGLIIEAGADDESQVNTEALANLITSAKAAGPYLGDFQHRFGKRMPKKRHPGGRLDVLFADLHGETTQPVKFLHSTLLGENLPSKYAPQVRISPYPPREDAVE